MRHLLRAAFPVLVGADLDTPSLDPASRNRAPGSRLPSGELPIRQSLAHSAPIYISVADTPPLAEQEEAHRMARSWIALLDDLETALAEQNIEDLATRAASAHVPVETIRQNRPRLLSAIEEAREYFRAR